MLEILLRRADLRHLKFFALDTQRGPKQPPEAAPLTPSRIGPPHKHSWFYSLTRKSALRGTYTPGW